MAVEEELKRDHAEMQAVIEAKQKIIDAQVQTADLRTEHTPVHTNIRAGVTSFWIGSLHD